MQTLLRPLMAALILSPICLAQEDAAQSPIFASMQVSDFDIKVHDPVYFKLRISNRLESAVKVPGNDADGKRLALHWERREGREEWKSLGALPFAAEGSSIKVTGKGAYALYGIVFGEEVAFDRASTYDVRIRLKCLYGDLVSESATIIVRERSRNELELLSRDRFGAASSFHSFFNASELRQRLFEPIQELRRGLKDGSLDKSLELANTLQDFLETGSIQGKTFTFKGALDTLAPELDEVRRDYAAMVLCYHALKRDKLDDATALLAELKDESLIRSNLRFGLTNKLKRAALPKP